MISNSVFLPLEVLMEATDNGILETRRIDENDLMPGAATTSSDSFFSFLSPEAKAVAQNWNLPEYVTVKNLGDTVQRIALLLSLGHSLLDLVVDERERRQEAENKEEIEWTLLKEVEVEHREFANRELLDSDRRRVLMEKALRKFYEKAVCIDSFFHQMWTKHKSISQKKLQVP